MPQPRKLRPLVEALSVVAFVNVAGCATDPDIVAMRPKLTQDAALMSPPERVTCEAGRYSGTMNARPGEGGASVSFSGIFEFTLVKSLSGEFLVLQDAAKLSGTGADKSMFTADIQGGGGCTTGSTFTTKLIDGMYVIPGLALTIPFEGSIVGAYSSEFHSFWGDWTTNLRPPLSAQPLVVGGSWSATYAGAN